MKKYAHVPSRLSTQHKVRYLTNNEVLRRRDEIFLRVSRDELAELFEEYEKHDDENVLRNTGDGSPRICVYAADDQVEYERPYLILDVRSVESFEACHLLQARSLPQRLLMQDKMPVELYTFKNKDSKLIILYDDYERLAAAAAHQLVHRGFNNVFVLSKGIVGFAATFPSYVEGDTTTLPSPTRPHPSSKNTATTKSPRLVDDTSSRMTDLSVAETVISRATSRKTRF